jgi:predicted ribosome quality control (RQC) complex YloA/Tae2 family protein
MMELAVLRKVAEELDELLGRGHVNKIHQPLPREIVLRIRVPGAGEKRLMISADPRVGRAHLTSLRIPNPQRPPRFCAYLRSHLQGALITGVSCAPDDRVLRIAAIRGPREEPSRRDLVLELLGRDSNILLVDGATGLIMECLHRIPEKEHGTRIVLPNYRYEPPPKHAARVRDPVDESESGPVAAGITTLPSGKKRLTLHGSAPEDELFDSMNEAADAFFTRELGSILLEASRRSLLGPLKSKMRSLQRRLGKIEADGTRLKKLAERQEEGELLKANLHRVRKGAASIEVEDWATGRKRLVNLDPALDAVANMERIFKRAAKGKRGERKVPARLRETREERAALEDLIFFVESAVSAEELDRLAPELPRSRVQAGTDAQPAVKRSGKGTASLLRTFRTGSGREVLVGRSGKGNDQILRKARKGDLWFHVEGVPGAHVLLPRRDKGPPDPDDVEFAAGLAVEFSKAKGKGRVEVIVADVKDVSRLKGALPGQVRVRRRRTITSEGAEIPVTPEHDGAHGQKR